MDLSNHDKLNELNEQKIIEFAPAIAYVVIVMVFGICGNCFSVAFYGRRAAKTTANVLITALAAIDLVNCLVFCNEIIQLCYTLTLRNVIGCRIMYFFSHWMVYTSCLILLFLSVERYLMICKRKSWQITIKFAKFGIAAVVIFCGLMSVRDFFVIDIVLVNLTVADSNKSVTAYYCAHSKDTAMESVIYVFKLIELFVLLIITISMIILYSFVAIKVWKYRKKSRKSVKKSKTSAVIPEISATSSRLVVDTDVTISGMEEETNLTISTTVAEPNLSKHVKTFGTNALSEDTCDKVDTDTNQTTQSVSYDKHKRSGSESSSGEQMEETRGNTRNKTRKYCTRQITRTKRARNLERKIAVMMIATTAASIVSFCPHFILTFVMKSTQNIEEFNVGQQIIWRSFLLNSAINPYVMGYFNTQFRQFFKHVFCKCLS